MDEENLDDTPDPWWRDKRGVVRDENGLTVLAHELAAESRVEYSEYRSRYACACGRRWTDRWCSPRPRACPKCGASSDPVASKVAETDYFKPGKPCPMCGEEHGEAARLAI